MAHAKMAHGMRQIGLSVQFLLENLLFTILSNYF